MPSCSHAVYVVRGLVETFFGTSRCPTAVHARVPAGAFCFVPRGPFHRVAQIYLRDQWRDLLRAPVSFVLSVSFGGIRPKHPQVFLARATLTGNPFCVLGIPTLEYLFRVSGQTCVSERFSTLRVEKPKQHHRVVVASGGVLYWDSQHCYFRVTSY